MSNQKHFTELNLPSIVSFQIVPLGYEWQINSISETGRANPLFYSPNFISRFQSVKEATDFLIDSGVLPESIKTIKFEGGA